MDRPSSQSGEQRAFRDVVGVEVGETCHGLIEDRVQLLILNMAVHPINAVLYRHVIGNLVGRFATESLGSDGTGHIQFLDDRLFCHPRKKSKSITASLLLTDMLKYE